MEGTPQPYPVIPQQPRAKEMRVLCLGMSRTSTMSLWAALGILGIKSYHAMECSLDNANDSLLHWNEAIQAKYFGKGKPYEGKDFDKMLWRYDAVTDIPAILFVDELLEAYPDAKVVLTIRDVDSWMNSVERSFYEILSWKRWRILQALDAQFTRLYIPFLVNTLKIWTKGDWQNREKLREAYAEHNAHVRRVVSPEKLLEFHATHGWEPLCKHLGVPIPDRPYPYLNEGSFTSDLHYQLFWGRLIVSTGQWLKTILPAATVVGAGWYLLRSEDMVRRLTGNWF